MNKEEILEGNKLIAEFMGGEFLHDFNPNYVTFKPINFGDMEGNYSCLLNDCYFDSSWSWLMPVVEKIENLDKGYKFKQCRKRVDIVEDWGTELFVLNTKGKSKIESVWLAVIEFIKWYNNKKQQS